MSVISANVDLTKLATMTPEERLALRQTLQKLMPAPKEPDDASRAQNEASEAPALTAGGALPDEK